MTFDGDRKDQGIKRLPPYLTCHICLLVTRPKYTYGLDAACSGSGTLTDGSIREWARVCAGTSGKVDSLRWIVAQPAPNGVRWQNPRPMACQASGLAPLTMLSQHQVPDTLLSYM